MGMGGTRASFYSAAPSPAIVLTIRKRAMGAVDSSYLPPWPDEELQLGILGKTTRM